MSEAITLDKLHDILRDMHQEAYYQEKYSETGRAVPCPIVSEHEQASIEFRIEAYLAYRANDLNTIAPCRRCFGVRTEALARSILVWRGSFHMEYQLIECPECGYTDWEYHEYDDIPF